MKTTDGRALSVPDAQHPTVVYFMAAWCVSCVQGPRGDLLFRSESLPNPTTLRRAVQLALWL